MKLLYYYRVAIMILITLFYRIFFFGINCKIKYIGRRVIFNGKIKLSDGVRIKNDAVINYKLLIQFKDIMPYLLLSLAMYLIVILSGSLLETVSIGLKLLIQMLLGALTYITLNMAFKTMAFVELKNILYNKLIKR